MAQAGTKLIVLARLWEGTFVDHDFLNGWVGYITLRLCKSLESDKIVPIFLIPLQISLFIHFQIYLHRPSSVSHSCYGF